MGKIAKKSRPVKGDKKAKQPPRYTIRKDSLDRRYAIDKRTGKRVSVSKADNERAKRRAASTVTKRPKAARTPRNARRGEKAPQIFRGIKPVKAPKVKIPRVSSKKQRSEAAKRGWETRRAKAIPPPPPSTPTPVYDASRPPPTFAELIGPLIPEGVRMHVVAGVADRADKYPKVAKAASRAWMQLQSEAFILERQLRANEEPEPIPTPRFDRLYGEGHGTFIRFTYYARATDLQDIDQMVDDLEQDEDNDYGARELYTLYFSPEVA